MIKLLKAGFFRLKKDVIFWLFIFLTIGMAGFTLFRYLSVEGAYLDKILNEFIMYIGLFIAIFVSIFVGKEYGQGIIRNKIIVGHSRISIFLSNLIISIVVSLLCELIYLIIVFLIGIPLFGQMQMSFSQFAIVLLNTALVIISFCSIYNFITMICSEITISISICIILFVAMFVAQAALGFTANSRKYKEQDIIPNISICSTKVYKIVNKISIIRVFENILSNVVKYSNGDLKVEMQENGTITFSNKATSLDETTVQKIFDRYFSVENAKESTGIGLSIAKQLVELNNGSIKAEYVNGYLIIEIKL